MAGSVNKVILIGNLGRDPEIRSTQSGDKIASFSLATSESWKDKQTGERKEKTEWTNISVFNSGLVGVIERFVKKGSKVYIEGALQTRKWTDKNGNDRYTTEVVLSKFNGTLCLLDGNKGPSSDGDAHEPIDGHNSAKANGFAPESGLDDEIPF
jgi:single-strand DNA-binding protein